MVAMHMPINLDIDVVSLATVPSSTMIVLGLVYLVPILAYLLYRYDMRTNDGYISILGYRGRSE